MKPRKQGLKRTPLKPGKQLERKVPMPRGNGLQRSGSSQQSSGSASQGSGRSAPHGPVKARRETKPGMAAAERRARDLVWARASKPHGIPACERCGVAVAREYQHRKAKAHCTAADLWAPSNGLAVCGHGNVDGCHGAIHQGPARAYRNGWSVRSGHDPMTVPVLRRGIRVLFDDFGGFAPVGDEGDTAA